MTLKPSHRFTALQPQVRLGDPHVWSDAANHLNVRWSVYEALVRYGEGGSYEPALAESWTLSDDARTWTFALPDRVAPVA